MEWQVLGPDLFFFNDSCNVYLLRWGDRALAIDFGSGGWLDKLDQIGVAHLEAVVLTHAHRDQCFGLYRRNVPCPVHVPRGDAPLLRAKDLANGWKKYQANGCPPTYAAPLEGIPHQADLSADGEECFGPVQLCALATPGHTRGALSYLVEWQGKTLAFCGDAAHAKGTVYQPYHLEWDHWTPSGALAAWHGLERLGYCHFDWLLPSHGPVLKRGARACVHQTKKRLMALIRAKGSVCAGEKNRWAQTEAIGAGARRISPHLYHFGGNGFLVTSRSGHGLVIDPTKGDMPHLERLVATLGLRGVDTATATHYHCDHTDALNDLHRLGARVWLHPWVAQPLIDRDCWDLPWLPAESIAPDRILPTEGIFRWREYRFAVRPFPGQTWWHCAFDSCIDGQVVLFSGDNFQPPSRWNGTGGFCAFNGSRFADGFARSAQAALALAPDLVCNGHGCIYHFAPSHYRRILRWSDQAQRAVDALAPSGNWRKDWDPRLCHFEPFVSSCRPGQRVKLALVYHNRTDAPIALEAAAVVPAGWSVAPGRRRRRQGENSRRRFSFVLQVPKAASPGRYLASVDLKVDGRTQGEACVALIDIQ